jgi:hypothetical protein
VKINRNHPGSARIRQIDLPYTGETGGCDEIQTRIILLDREQP